MRGKEKCDSDPYFVPALECAGGEPRARPISVRSVRHATGYDPSAFREAMSRFKT